MAGNLKVSYKDIVIRLDNKKEAAVILSTGGSGKFSAYSQIIQAAFKCL